MKQFNIYAVGGTAIKITNRYLKDNKNGKHIENIVGFDSSDADAAADGLYPLERLEGASGSGGFRHTHKEKWGDFSKAMLAKYAPNKTNIVIFSTGGGTGASLGPWIVRRMLERKIPVLAIVVGDSSSFNEQSNTIETLGSLYNQTSLGHPVIFSYLENKSDTTHGEINAMACARIDNAIMMFSLENDSIDEQDIKNFFYYTDIVSADPIMSQLTFLTDQDVGEYKSKPVAAISLFADPDKVRSPFQDMLYRKAGVFGPSFHGINTGIHAVLDHGDTLEGLKRMINDKQVKTDELAGRFSNRGANPFGNASGDDGMM
jgi:hypothetical protein